MKVGKKILAVLCAVVLCLGSMNLPDLSSVEAAYKDVTSIVLKNVEGLVYADEYGIGIDELEETSIKDSCWATYNDADSSVTLTPINGGQFTSNRIFFYIKAAVKPTISRVTSVYSASISDSGIELEDEPSLTLWEVAFTLLSGASGEISVTPVPGVQKYKVSFPDDSDYYTIQDDLAGTTSDVEADKGLTFSVELVKDVDQYDVSAKANGVTIANVQKVDNLYTFTIDKLTRDTNITIELTKKTYTVTLPEATDFFTVESATTNTTVSAGDSFTFYVSPKTGANNPTVNVKEGTGGASVTLRQPVTGTYVISNITADTEIEVSDNGWKDVNIVLTPGSNFTFEDASTSAKYNSPYTFKVVPKDGYRVTNVYTTNGLAVSALGDNTYQIESLTAESVTIMATAEIISCSITPPESVAGFKFTMEGSSSISYGSSLVFYVDPTEGYETPTVKIKEAGQADSEAVTLEPGANNRYSYANVTNDMVILVEPGALRTLNVNFVDGEGFTYSDITMTPPAIVRDANKTVAYGGEVSFKVTPAPGYSISLVTYNTSNVVTSADGVYTISNVKENLVINVTVARVKCEVSFNEPQEKNYDLILGTSPVEYGSSYSFYATAKEGYGAPIVTVNEVTYTPVANGQYIIPNITDATTINIQNGEPLSYTVTLNPGNGYKYYNLNDEEMSGNISVSYNGELKFKLVLDSYYDQSEAEVSVGGVKVSPTDGVYTISSIKADQIVSVTGVTKNSYRVTLTQGEGYELTTTENTVVTAGSTFKFRLTAKTGYSAENAAVYAGTQEEALQLGDDGYYSVTVTADTTITVTGVEAIKPAVSIVAPNASVTDGEGMDRNNIAYGGTYRFTVTPNKGYQLNQVAVNGVVMTPFEGVYTISNITSDQEIKVSTEMMSATVHYVDNKYNFGEDVSYTIESMQDDKVSVKTVESASQVYAFDGWYDGDVKVTEITADQLGKEMTLTARWIPIFEKLMEITTEGAEVIEDLGTDTVQYVVTYTTFLRFSEQLSEEYNRDVRITGYGTLYSPNEINTSNMDLQQAVLNRDRTIEDGIKTQTNVAGMLLSNYFRNRDLEPSMIGSETGTTFGLLKYSANPMDRWGAGWIELSVGEYRMVVYSNPVNVTYNPDVENGTQMSAEAQARAAEAQEEEESTALNAAQPEETELPSAVVEEAAEEETAEQAAEAAQEQETVQNTEAETEVTSEETSAAPQEDVNAANASEEAPAVEDVVEITEAAVQ